MAQTAPSHDRHCTLRRCSKFNSLDACALQGLCRLSLPDSLLTMIQSVGSLLTQIPGSSVCNLSKSLGGESDFVSIPNDLFLFCSRAVLFDQVIMSIQILVDSAGIVLAVRLSNINDSAISKQIILIAERENHSPLTRAVIQDCHRYVFETLSKPFKTRPHDLEPGR